MTRLTAAKTDHSDMFSLSAAHYLYASIKDVCSFTITATLDWQRRATHSFTRSNFERLPFDEEGSLPTSAMDGDTSMA
jgi:hypothetical protein